MTLEKLSFCQNPHANYCRKCLKSSTWALISSTMKQGIRSEFSIDKITVVWCVLMKVFKPESVKNSDEFETSASCSCSENAHLCPVSFKIITVWRTTSWWLLLQRQKIKMKKQKGRWHVAPDSQTDHVQCFLFTVVPLTAEICCIPTFD